MLSHKAYGARQAMVKAGIASSLLELTLLGSTLAQNRESRILECLTVDKGKHVPKKFGGGLSAIVSTPICGSSSSAVHPNHQFKEYLGKEDDKMSEKKKTVKNLVQQSLHNNMRRTVKRANQIYCFG
ncbi:unnamed protein product [Ilex paraguariensis]|uniref:Uncharacterized protein n=1 Tax=Ilex paraguariensis TaxID=185542 RepID=A0ABC8UYH0_9AQUA